MQGALLNDPICDLLNYDSGLSRFQRHSLNQLCVNPPPPDITIQVMKSAMQEAHMFQMASLLISTILLGKFLEAASKKKTIDKL